MHGPPSSGVARSSATASSSSSSSRLKRPYTPAGFSKEQKDILLAYASANPDWQGEFTAELAERLAGSKYKPSTQEKLVKKFYEGLQDGLSMRTPCNLTTLTAYSLWSYASADE